MVDILSNKLRDEQASYDLGWLLQNEQVSDERLCSFLVVETSVEIERLVYLFLRSPDDRLAAVDQILFNVLLQRRTYKNNISGKAWLYQRVLAECMVRVPRYLLTRHKGIHQVLRAIDRRHACDTHFNLFLDSLTEPQHLFAILHYGQNLSAEEIAVVLSIGLKAAHADLEQVQQILLAHQRACEDCSTRHSTLKGMEITLRAALQSNDHRVETARENSPERAGALMGRLGREKPQHEARQWAVRGAAAGLVVLLLAISGWASIITGSIQSWFSTSTEIPVIQVAALLPTSQPQPDPTSTPAPLPPVAAAAPDNAAEDVLSLTRANQARWHSLWADVQVTIYTMENYSDGTSSQPWASLRKQIWLSLPGSARVVSGPPLGSPDITYAVTGDQISGQNFASGQTIESSASDLIPDTDLQKLFSPADMFTAGGQFSRIGSEMVAGRPAWVLDWRTGGHRAYRYWVDQEYGVVLRRLGFGQGVFQPVASDITVTKIFYNADFPSGIYAPDHYKGDHFAHDFSGYPEIQDLKSALQTWSRPAVMVSLVGNAPAIQYNLATAQLSFHNVPAGWMQSADGPGLELFANQHDLGKLPLGGKSILACERSPDGSRIAYNSPPQDGLGDTTLLVADLASIQSARPALADGITAGDFAFSPDNRHLAFFGCEKGSGFCGIFILDIASGKLTRLVPLAFADYITWSPDGRSIALVGDDDTSEQSRIFSTTNLITKEMQALQHTWHFQVIDASSGNVTYKTEFEWFDLGAPSDSPTNAWDSPFKVSRVGFKGCTIPPDHVQ